MREGTDETAGSSDYRPAKVTGPHPYSASCVLTTSCSVAALSNRGNWACVFAYLCRCLTPQ